MSVFRWAEFRSTKSGIRIHTQIDIVTEIPVFYRITNAKVHDVNSMDWFTYQQSENIPTGNYFRYSDGFRKFIIIFALSKIAQSTE